MKIGVVGAREGRTREEVDAALLLFVQKGDVIVSGGARGVDRFAADFARKNEINLIEFLPNMALDEPYASRNRQIAAECEVLLAFPTDSGGTWQTIGFAKEAGKRVIIVRGV